MKGKDKIVFLSTILCYVEGGKGLHILNPGPVQRFMLQLLYLLGQKPSLGGLMGCGHDWDMVAEKKSCHCRY